MSKISAIQQNGGKDLSKQYEKLKREYEELKSQIQAGNSTPIRGSSRQIQGSVAVGRDDTEQKQAEQALESLAKFPDENPYPVLRFSAEGEILYANSASQVLLQYWETTGANPQRVEIVERVKESLEKKSIVQSEVTIGGVSFSLTIIPIIEHQYVNVYAADITERKHAEMELQATNRRTIEILGSISDAFYSLDQEFRFTYVNRKAASLWGKQPEELVGKNIWEVFPSGKQTESYQKMQQVYCDKEPIRYESFSAYLNQWVDIHIYPTEQGISVYFRDITERKKAEQALQESEQRYRKLFESLQEGMFLAEVITNEQGIPVDWRYLDVNLETQHYMGMTYEQFIGHRYSEVVPHPDPAWIALLGRVALTGQPAIQEMFSPARQRWLQVSVQSPRPGQAIVLFIDITERKRAEEALRESELFYRQSLESIPGMVFTTRPDGYCDYQSQQWVDYTSVPMSQHIGDGWNNLLHPEDQPRALAAWRDAVEGRAPYNLEYRVRRSDGQYEWFKVIGRPIRDAAGKIVRWFGVATNINELIKTEEALSQSEEHFRQLADAMPQLVWTARPDGTIDYVNNRYLEYDEVYPGEIGNSEWTFYIHPDDQEQTVAAWQQALVDGDVFQTEQRLSMKNGTYRWHLSRGVPVCDENGQVVKWYGTSTDIHDLKQVEDSLRISEQRLRKLVDANIIGILYRSEDGRVLEANNAYLDITGCSRQELEEGLINTFEITPEEFHQLDNEAMYEARKKGSCQPYEKEYIHKDGKRIPVLIGFAQLDPSEQALVGFVLDLSQLKHTEAALQDYANRLEQSNKELEHFAYIASHDLQEPLRKIKLFGERVSIRIGEQIDDETKDFLDRMQDASRRMEMMIDDLLQLSRVNTRGCPFVLVDLMKVAQEVVSDLGYRIQESGGRVVVEELPDIHADPIQIHQLLQNLIGNALKFHKPGTAPQVKVYARTNGKAESPETVKLYVSDNGVGFNEEYAERIFQPFERLVGRSEYEGSGIGLAICKKIVERHGGTITARSKRGEGSTFSITLPCKNNESRKQRKI